MIATVLAGGALAAAGQAALSHALPAATDGANVLKLSVQELVGAPAASVAAPLVDIAPAVDPAPAEPTVADIGELVKAAEMKARSGSAVASPRPAPTIDFPPVRADAAPEAPTAEGPAVTAGEVQMVAGRVTSGFGTRWGRQHRGLDVAAPIGTPINAPLAGEVIASGPASGFGMWVRVRHDDGTVTTYGHVNRSLVRVGEEVSAGQEIAEVGNRGRSTGPHLHIEVETPGGTKIDPRPWLDGHGIGY